MPITEFPSARGYLSAGLHYFCPSKPSLLSYPHPSPYAILFQFQSLIEILWHALLIQLDSTTAVHDLNVQIII